MARPKFASKVPLPVDRSPNSTTCLMPGPVRPMLPNGIRIWSAVSLQCPKYCRSKIFCQSWGGCGRIPRIPLDPPLFLTPCHVSFTRYSPLSLDVDEKPNKCINFFDPNFFGRNDPHFLRQIVSAIYGPPYGIIWLSCVCWSPCAKPGNEVECRTYRGWVNWRSNFKPFADKSF